MAPKNTDQSKKVSTKSDSSSEQVSPSPDPKQITKEIDTLSKSIIGQAEALRSHVGNSEIQRSLQELRDATTVFKTMADAAAQQTRFQAQELINTPANPTILHTTNVQDRVVSPIPRPYPTPPTNSEQGSGCSKGCGEDVKPKCCVQVYISKVRVLEGQSLPEAADNNQLELIIAVQAQDSWGLVPGLSSNIGVNAKSGWVAVHGPVNKFCVPCDRPLTIPLFVEAMEVETTIAGGRPEFGSNTGAIVLRCDCEIISQRVEVNLNGGGTTGGRVEVEISAKKVGGGCC